MTIFKIPPRYLLTGLATKVYRRNYKDHSSLSFLSLFGFLYVLGEKWWSSCRGGVCLADYNSGSHSEFKRNPFHDEQELGLRSKCNYCSDATLYCLLDNRLEDYWSPNPRTRVMFPSIITVYYLLSFGNGFWSIAPFWLEGTFANRNCPWHPHHDHHLICTTWCASRIWGFNEVWI